MNLSNLKIRSKIWLSVLIIVFGYALTLFMNGYLDKKIALRLESTISIVLPLSQALKENVTLFKAQIKSYEDGVLSGEEEDITLALSFRDKIISNINKSIEMDSDNTNFNFKLESLKANLQDYSIKADKTYKLLAAEDESERVQIEAKTLSKTKKKLATKFFDVSLEQENKLKNSLKQCISEKVDQQQMIYIIFFSTLLLSYLFIALLINKYISKPIKEATDFAFEVQKGILSKRLDVQSKDEIGDLSRALDNMADELQSKANMAKIIASGDLTQQFSLASNEDVLGISLQGMLNRLKELVEKVTISANGVTLQSGQISDFSQLLAEGSTQQSSAIQEITSTMTQISAMSTQSAKNAKEVYELSKLGSESASMGTIQMKKLVDAMDKIQNSSQSMAKVIKNIDEIAFQTNMIALNAAVEAARAGQMGKGFAVVAEEVRSLAGRSAEAAQQSTVMIEGSFEEVKAGQEVLSSTELALLEIVKSYEQVSSHVSTISEASVEQELGINGMSNRLDQIDDVTQKNTANAEEMASAASELANGAKELQKLLANFKVERASNKIKSIIKREKKFVAPKVQKTIKKEIKKAVKESPIQEKSNKEASGWDKIKEQSDKGFQLDLDSGDDYIITPNDKVYVDEKDFGRF
ncbi:MAG: hypothetical protein COB02_02300 [Candidatus Cloacimonadota bacterium]|nr:MAG: hypothetical protein COB02_02300 [Candidatus Cloacimonadota bacterium]